MAIKNRTDLKSFFVKNAIPTEGNFADLIDSALNQSVDGIFKLEGEPLSIVAATNTQKRALRLYGTYPAANPDWMIALNPTQGTDMATARAGLGLTDGAGNTRLFIDAATGSVGVGTNNPQFGLDVLTGARANGFRSRYDLALADYRTVNPGSNVALHSPPGDRDAWIYRDVADAGSNWGLYHRQIDSAVAGLPANSIGFIGGGANKLQAYVNLGDGSGYFAGPLRTDASLGIGAGAATPAGALDVRVPGGVGTWDRFVVTATTAWGDGAANPYVTIGAGGAAGIMFQNPHVVWYDNRASIRYGRAGGVGSGAWWDAGVRSDGSFSFARENGVAQLSIGANGVLAVPGGLMFEGAIGHIERDGAIYRNTDGQCYVTVDDFFRIRRANAGSHAAQFNTSNGGFEIAGNIGTNGYASNSGLPNGWGGGVHTWDLAVRGTGRSASGWQTGAWDLAEKFNNHDRTLEPGDVVAADLDSPERLIPSERAYQENLLGVISENPGFLLGVSWEDPRNPTALALAGRVPVKVNLEGGPIKIGDYLTSSGERGHAMKAGRSGRVIGMALEAFDGTKARTGKVVVFINPQFRPVG